MRVGAANQPSREERRRCPGDLTAWPLILRWDRQLPEEGQPAILAREADEHLALPALAHPLDPLRRDVDGHAVLEPWAEQRVDVRMRRTIESAVLMNRESALGATDGQIFVQFLLEALVLAALGALSGTLAGTFLCQALSSQFPYGLVVNPFGLMLAWAVALGLALLFGLYPAFRAMRLSPMEAMR